MNVIECKDIVTLEDFNGNGWFCIVQEELSESLIYKMKNISTRKDEDDDILPIERGLVWIYTSLGSAIIGKKIGDIVSYSISGVEKRCIVRNILKTVKDYLM